MKKQYRCIDNTWAKRDLLIYHDGILVDCKTYWLSEVDELNDKMDDLEADGYTWGYYKDEVENVKIRYEHMAKNVIDEM